MFEHAVELRAPSLSATHEIAAAIGGLVRPGDVILLTGEMGAGKTAFVQGFGRSLGITDPITSPTFTLVHSYDVPGRRLMVHHADLYRLERTTEIADLALLELAEDHGVVVVEWGEVADQFLGDHLAVSLERDPDELESEADDDFGLDEGRLLELSASGPTWAGRWSSLTSAVEGWRC